jgi:hypothetical protein
MAAQAFAKMVQFDSEDSVPHMSEICLPLQNAAARSSMTWFTPAHEFADLEESLQRDCKWSTS